MAEEPDVEYAEEMPDYPADVVGLFARREDNRVFVQSGDVTMNIRRDEQGNVELGTHAKGPTVEVIVTHDTLIYRDDTFTQHREEARSETVRQVLAAGTLDEVGEHSSVRVWGEKRGDRIVAAVLVYAIPAALR
jgi:hypothetical protein